MGLQTTYDLKVAQTAMKGSRRAVRELAAD